MTKVFWKAKLKEEVTHLKARDHAKLKTQKFQQKKTKIVQSTKSSFLQRRPAGFLPLAVRLLSTVFQPWQDIKQHFLLQLGGDLSAPSATGGDRATSIAKEPFRRKGEGVGGGAKTYSCRSLPALRLHSPQTICRPNWSSGGFKGQRRWEVTTRCACVLSQRGIGRCSELLAATAGCSKRCTVTPRKTPPTLWMVECDPGRPDRRGRRLKKKQ